MQTVNDVHLCVLNADEDNTFAYVAASRYAVFAQSNPAKAAQFSAVHSLYVDTHTSKPSLRAPADYVRKVASALSTIFAIEQATRESKTLNVAQRAQYEAAFAIIEELCC